MIVKIKSEKKAKLNGWIFYDGLTRVHYDFVDEASVKDYEVDARWFDAEDGVALLIRALKRDGQEFLVLTNRTTYLLNDEGKTIERLN